MNKSRRCATRFTLVLDLMHTVSDLVDLLRNAINVVRHAQTYRLPLFGSDQESDAYADGGSKECANNRGRSVSFAEVFGHTCGTGNTDYPLVKNLLLLVTILTQTLLALVRCDLVPFSLLS